jgi:hypothetical protein
MIVQTARSPRTSAVILGGRVVVRGKLEWVDTFALEHADTSQLLHLHDLPACLDFQTKQEPCGPSLHPATQPSGPVPPIIQSSVMDRPLSGRHASQRAHSVRSSQTCPPSNSTIAWHLFISIRLQERSSGTIDRRVHGQNEGLLNGAKVGQSCERIKFLCFLWEKVPLGFETEAIVGCNPWSTPYVGWSSNFVTEGRQVRGRRRDPSFR